MVRRAWAVAVMVVGLGVGRAAAQDVDTLFVDVKLPGIGQVLTEAITTPTDTLFLLDDVAALCGHNWRTGEWLTPQAIGERLAVATIWSMERLILVLDDRTRACPALRDKLDEARAQSQAAAAMRATTNTSGRVGLGAAVTVQEGGEQMLEGAYRWQRFSVYMNHSSVAGLLWSASAAPLRGLWLTYTDSETREPAASARLSVGRQFVALTYREGGVTGDAALTLGPLVLYAAPWGDRYVATYRAPHVTVQAAQLGDVHTFRVSYGSMNSSVFNVAPVRSW